LFLLVIVLYFLGCSIIWFVWRNSCSAS